MPKIDEYIPNKTKKFQKKEYRPWDSHDSGKKVFQENKSSENTEILEEFPVSGEEKTSEIIFDFDRIIRGLYGPQKEILIFLINCDDEGLIHSINYEEAAQKIGVSVSHFKMAARKFRKIGLIELIDSKPGKGGYACFSIAKSAQVFFSKNKLLREG